LFYLRATSQWALIPEAGVTRAIWNTYIAAINVPVPEPGTNTLMLAGLEAVGAASRRQRKNGPPSAVR